MTVTLVEHYNSDWPDWFRRLKAFLGLPLDGVALGIEHVGSTAVPGMTAKPALVQEITTLALQVGQTTMTEIETQRAGRVAFRQTASDEVEQAYAIICETVDWLRGKGIRQWTEPLPREILARRQRHGENFALFRDGRMAVVLSLVRECSDPWHEETDGKIAWWLCTLATANAFRGNQLGRTTVRKTLSYLRDEAGAGELFLDCAYGNGFLPEFYGSLGFRLVRRKVIDWPKCGPTDMVLMRRDLAT